MLGRSPKRLMRRSLLRGLISTKSVWFFSLALWAFSIWIRWRTNWSDHYSFELLVIDLILPLVFQIWGYLLGVFVSVWFIWAKWKKTFNWSDQTKSLLRAIALNFLVLLILWPPRSLMQLVRNESDQNNQEHSDTSRHETLNVLSWNVQRMGELARSKKQSVQNERAQCIVSTVRQLEKTQGRSIEVFAFQETSNKGLRKLETLLSLSCQFVSYHPTRHKHTGGLGICVRLKSKWKLNYVRKISLQGTGRWRALFAEVSRQNSPRMIFNVINVHFLPHQIDPEDIKSLLTSPLAALTLFRMIRETSNIQRSQAEGLLDLIKNYQDPTLLMGDFNAPPRAGAHTLLKVAWTDVWQEVGTASGDTRYFDNLIPLRVDYIYALAGTFLPLRSIVSDLTRPDCSDHLPLSAELKLLR